MVSLRREVDVGHFVNGIGWRVSAPMRRDLCGMGAKPVCWRRVLLGKLAVCRRGWVSNGCVVCLAGTGAGSSAAGSTVSVDVHARGAAAARGERAPSDDATFDISGGDSPIRDGPRNGWLLLLPRRFLPAL